MWRLRVANLVLFVASSSIVRPSSIVGGFLYERTRPRFHAGTPGSRPEDGTPGAGPYTESRTEADTRDAGHDLERDQEVRGSYMHAAMAGTALPIVAPTALCWA